MKAYNIGGIDYLVTETGTVKTDWGDFDHVEIGRADEGEMCEYSQVYNVKEAIWGRDRAAIEVYPRSDRLVNDDVHRHLWLLPEGENPPFGIHWKDQGQ